MSIEIGSLVVRGTFGHAAQDHGATMRLEDEMARLKAELRAELREMLREAERRRRDA